MSGDEWTIPDSAADPRDFLLEVFGMARLQIEIAERAILLQDDVMTDMALRRIVAYLRAARATLKDVRQQREAFDEAAE